MLCLIDLYDRNVPYNNFLLARLLHPDELILIASEKEDDLAVARERFENFKRFFGLSTSLTFAPCDPGDLPGTVERMKEIIRGRGMENCAVDVIGGNETLLMAVGICAAGFPGLRVVGMRDSRLALVWGDSLQEEIRRANTELTVSEAISMAAGEMIRCGHADWRKLDGDTISLIPVMFEIYMRNRSAWPSFCAYLQRMNNLKYKVKEGVFSGPPQFTTKSMTGKKIWPSVNILRELSDAGVLTECRMTSTTCRLSFAHPQLVKFLCDTGSWLELYVFSMLRESGLFSDIEIDAVVSWDNDEDSDDTVNEVDLIAMKGLVPIFFSCKSGIPNNDAVHEIMAITRRFGSGKAKAVLVTACNTAVEASAVLKRTNDADVVLIDAPRLEKDEMLKCLRMI